MLYPKMSVFKLVYHTAARGRCGKFFRGAHLQRVVTLEGWEYKRRSGQK